MRRDYLPLAPLPRNEGQRRAAVNGARIDRLLRTDPAPWVHATTMDEIRLLAGKHGLLFKQAYQLAKRAKVARWKCLRDGEDL
jgi:hypothetical protein